MNSLLPLPAENETTLTVQEIKCITGASDKRLQIAWLVKNGWRHSTDRHGVPVIGRLYANLKLGGLDMATVVASSEWEPNHAAIGS